MPSQGSRSLRYLTLLRLFKGLLLSSKLLLDRTKLSDTVFDLLARCNLKRLSLNGAIGLTESGLLAHLESRSSYDWLQLDEQPLTDTGLEHIVSRFPSLRKLTVANCSLLSIKTIELIASKGVLLFSSILSLILYQRTILPGSIYLESRA